MAGMKASEGSRPTSGYQDPKSVQGCPASWGGHDPGRGPSRLRSTHPVCSYGASLLMLLPFSEPLHEPRCDPGGWGRLGSDCLQRDQLRKEVPEQCSCAGSFTGGLIVEDRTGRIHCRSNFLGHPRGQRAGSEVPCHCSSP